MYIYYCLLMVHCDHQGESLFGLDKTWCLFGLDKTWCLVWVDKTWCLVWVDKTWCLVWVDKTWCLVWLDKTWCLVWLDKTWCLVWVVTILKWITVYSSMASNTNIRHMSELIEIQLLAEGLAFCVGYGCLCKVHDLHIHTCKIRVNS